MRDLSLHLYDKCSAFIKTSYQLSGCWLHFPQIAGNVPRGHPDNVSASSQDPSSRVSLSKSHLTPPLRSTSITEASTLLRTAPPQCAASVLKPLWVRHLGVSLNIRTTGSRSSIGKPSTESCLLYAGHRLHSIRSSPVD